MWDAIMWVRRIAARPSHSMLDGRPTTGEATGATGPAGQLPTPLAIELYAERFRFRVAVATEQQHLFLGCQCVCFVFDHPAFSVLDFLVSRGHHRYNWI